MSGIGMENMIDFIAERCTPEMEEKIREQLLDPNSFASRFARAWDEDLKKAFDLDWVQLAEIESASPDNAGGTEKHWTEYLLWLTGFAAGVVSGISSRPEQMATDIQYFNDFRASVKAGRSVEFSKASNLWGLLVELSAKKKTSSSETVNDESAETSNDASEHIFANPSKYWPDTVEFGNQFAEECIRCFQILEACDESLRNIVSLKLQNYSDDEIAEKTGIPLELVAVGLEKIRHEWALEKEKSPENVS